MTAFGAFGAGLDLEVRPEYLSGMTLAEHAKQIDDRLSGAHAVLLDLASGHQVPAKSPAVIAALADLEAARELLHGLAAGPGQQN